MRSGKSPIVSIPGGPFAISQTRTFNFPDVTANSRVVVSISEVNSIGKPFIGDATLKLEGVTPNDDGEILVEVYIQWDEPIQFRITCFIDP